MDEANRNDGSGRPFGVFLSRLLLCAFVWWVLTDGELSWDSLLIGVPAVISAAGISAAMLPRIGWSWIGALKFATFFGRQSLLGGIDVARRAFHPRTPLDPAVVPYDARLASDPGRVALCNTAGLLPGSLVLDIDGSQFLVHALDVSRDVDHSMKLTESRVAEWLRVPLTNDEPNRSGSRGPKR